MLVILLISLTYYFVYSKASFEIKDVKNQFSFIKIKSFLLNNFPYENSLSLVCIESNFDCYIVIDGKIDSKRKIENVFASVPEIYEYNKDQIRLEFEAIRVDDIDYDVIFKYELNSDNKLLEEFIMDTLDDKVYVFNSLNQKPSLYKSLNEAFDIFEQNILEVKDAF